MTRRCGILLHPTALPGAHAIGDLGENAYRFVDWLHACGIGIWQVLPLTPPGPGDSPYSSFSSHAGSPALVSLHRLADEGLLDAGVVAEADSECRDVDPRRVDFALSARLRDRALALAADDFLSRDGPRRAAFDEWCANQAWWLEDDALFHALAQEQGTRDWTAWPGTLAGRDVGALAAARERLAPAIARWRFVQWVFDRQWTDLRRHANERGVHLLGDLPIYCAHHSVDVWSDRALFELDARGLPLAVAGVPPDYFSAQGQRWGNPLYDWPAHEEGGYRWWIARLQGVLKWCDAVRIDHFRAFASYWHVPAEEPTAIHGHWRTGPGRALFDAMRAALGELPIVAEDLGTITPDVIALRDAVGLPGMSVLQFAFGDGPHNVYLPHNLHRNVVVYPGTHDNDTCAGWWAKLDERTREDVSFYLGSSGERIDVDLVRAALASVADTAVIAMQDVLGLPTEARMNDPSKASGQWGWRLQWSDVTDDASARLARMVARYGRARR